VTDPEVLKQEEIDALLGGVDSGEISTADQRGPAGTPRRYDFKSEVPISGGRVPKLEMVSERFARLFRASLGTMLRHAVQVNVMPVSVQRSGDFPAHASVTQQHQPAAHGTAPWHGCLRAGANAGVGQSSINIRRQRSRREDRRARIHGHRIAHRRCDTQGPARRPEGSLGSVVAMEPEHFATESNPQFVNQISPAELVIAAPFHIELEGDGGDLQLLLPQAMIDPLRDRLDFGANGNSDKPDARWYESLRGEVEKAEVGIRTVLGNADVTLGKLLALRPGDVVPFDFAGQATVYAEGVPIFSGGFGGSRGQEAVKVERGARR